MIYEYEGIYFIKVANKYVEEKIEKQGKGFNVIPTFRKKYVADMPNVKVVTLEQAYNKGSRKFADE